MDALEEKRVFADRDGGAAVFVAAALGIVAVSVADDRVGEFGIARRCAPADIAAGGGRVAAATDEDVLVGGDDGFRDTGFGPAAAVGFAGDRLYAASPGGRIARLGEGSWREVGSIDSRPAAIDGDLVAAADGVYRLADRPVHAGLDDVRDVSVAGRPLAATANGLYSLGNGWMTALDGDFGAVAERPDGSLAHAIADEGAFERPADEWRPCALPTDERVVDVAYGAGDYAVTAGGTLLVDAGDGWRAHPIGVSDVVGVSAP